MFPKGFAEMIDQGKTTRDSIKKFFTAEVYLAMLLAGVLVFLGFATENFFSVRNIMSVLNRYSYILIAAIGMNMIILTGNIDVSAGAVISVVAIVIAMAAKQGATIVMFLPLAIVTGAFLCYINALIVTKFRIPSIVATLATTQIFYGILPIVVEGSIYDLPPAFTWLSFKAKIFGIVPLSVLFMLIIVVVALIFMKYSRFSKKLYAIGNNPQGAKLAGVNVDRTMIVVYVIAGCLFGVAATIIATQGERVTATVGNGMEMNFIAAVIVGGTSIAGGSGKLSGTIVGALLLSIITTALVFLKISSSWTEASSGIIILIAVIVGALKSYKFKRKHRQAGQVRLAKGSV